MITQPIFCFLFFRLVFEDNENGLFTVTLFKKVIDEFKLHARDNKYVTAWWRFPYFSPLRRRKGKIPTTPARPNEFMYFIFIS